MWLHTGLGSQNFNRDTRQTHRQIYTDLLKKQVFLDLVKIICLKMVAAGSIVQDVQSEAKSHQERMATGILI